MKYVYLVYEYKPKHKYGGYIYEGHYNHIPKIFMKIKDAREYRRKYKHASYMRKQALK